MFDYSYQLEETKQQLRNLINEYPVLENQAELTLDHIQKSRQKNRKTIKQFKLSWG